MRGAVLRLLCRLQCKQHGCKADGRMVMMTIAVEPSDCCEKIGDMRRWKQ